MLDVSVIAWVWMLSAMLVSSGAGLALSRLVTWTDPARQAGIPRAFGLAIAPFLLGLMAVVALGVFRGASHAFHLGVVFAGLLALCATACFTRPVGRPVSRETSQPMGLWDWIFGGILAVWVLALLVNAALLPLLQNDSLEYAIVGRLLFESRDLLSYPAIHPEQSSSGFYGPWTHPPLYVALIYLMYVFQGNADMPGLMRVISPWVAIAAAGIVFTLGNLTSRLTGTLSALFFLSVPLFFLGAGSALLDALPVLGIVLVMAAVVGMRASTGATGLQGLLLGAALWSHSVAVLFIPLTVIAIALNRGWRNIRGLLIDASSVVGIAVLFATWPYCRNFMVFGSLISDNPAVFAMPELAWDEYFRIARGIDSWPEKIQYGILKGWFALEAYSLLFWFMIAGTVLYLKRLHFETVWRDLCRGDVDKIPDGWGFTALGMVLCYFGGVVLSTLLGIDLMIRNERYWLILIPFAALLAGNGIEGIQADAKRNRKKAGPGQGSSLAKAFLPILALFFVLQGIVTIGFYSWAPYLNYDVFRVSLFRFNPTLVLAPSDTSAVEKFLAERGITDVTFRNEKGKIILERASAAIAENPAHAEDVDFVLETDKLFMWPHIKAVGFLRDHVPADAKILSLRPADMYYSSRRMISYLDPHLIPVYREDDALHAWTRLKGLGIDYLHIPDYYLPPIYNSVLSEILARPELSALIFSADGNQIYELRRREDRIQGDSVDLTPGEMPWTRVVKLTGGRKALASIGLFEPSLVMSQGASSGEGFRFFRRERSTEWISGLGVWNKPLALQGDVPLRGAHEYRLDIDLEGRAYVQVSLVQMNDRGQVLRGPFRLSARQMPLGEIVLGPVYPKRHFVRRFIAHPDATYVRVGVEQRGDSAIRIVKATLTPILTTANTVRH